MAGVALILLAAGLIETAGLYLGIGEILLWIPVGVVVYLVFRNRPRRHDVPTLGSA
jgi:lysyl-tRNA synthetase class I